MTFMNSKVLLCVAVFAAGVLTHAQAGTPGIQYDLKFDDMGRIIKPDEVYLSRGERSKSKEDWEGAYRSFKTSASYGNAWAKYYLALLYMKDKEFTSAMAWLNLLDGDFKEREKVAYFKQWLEPMMSAAELQAAKIPSQ